MEKRLKADILAKLDYLPNLINFKKSTPETVVMTAMHSIGRYCDYVLKIEVVVDKKIVDGNIEINDFHIESVVLTKNKGETKHNFSIKELTDYIDF